MRVFKNVSPLMIKYLKSGEVDNDLFEDKVKK